MRTLNRRFRLLVYKHMVDSPSNSHFTHIHTCITYYSHIYICVCTYNGVAAYVTPVSASGRYLYPQGSDGVSVVYASNPRPHTVCLHAPSTSIITTDAYGMGGFIVRICTRQKLLNFSARVYACVCVTDLTKYTHIYTHTSLFI